LRAICRLLLPVVAALLHDATDNAPVSITPRVFNGQWSAGRASQTPTHEPLL
jgi:hypothetical protein